jgi:hypothetical protein
MRAPPGGSGRYRTNETAGNEGRDRADLVDTGGAPRVTVAGAPQVCEDSDRVPGALGRSRSEQQPKQGGGRQNHEPGNQQSGDEHANVSHLVHGSAVLGSRIARVDTLAGRAAGYGRAERARCHGGSEQPATACPRGF